MLIPCKEIAHILEETLSNQVHDLKKKGIQPKLLALLLGESPAQLSFVAIKRRLAEKLGVGFEFLHIPTPPPFTEFITLLQGKMADRRHTGVLIQHPLPPGYDMKTVYETVPVESEIEGHKAESQFQFPLSLAVLTGIKYVYGYAQKNKPLDPHIMVNFYNDAPFFYDSLKDKKIVIVGRGSTGGKPIAECLKKLHIAHEIVHRETPHPESIYKHADIIITATGRHILEPQYLKKNVVLLNVGLRKEQDKLTGDFDENTIKDIASFYTQTPGGLGPLDVLYLYKNLIDASHHQ